MDEVGFICATRELIDKVSKLISLQKGLNRKQPAVEIRVQSHYVSFHTLVGEVKCYCLAKGWGSYPLCLEYFYMVLTRMESAEVLTLKIPSKGELND